MNDRIRQGGGTFRIAGIKTAMTSVASSSHSVPRSGDGLQQQFTRDDAPVKTTEYTLLQLINMVRENPILYDEELQSSTQDAQLKLQKREVWDRIRADIVWQDITPIQDVWVDILDQYSRKSSELSDVLLEAMRWTDSLINKKKFTADSRPPSQLNPMSSALDKDFYTDVPLAEDVLEPGQNIGSTSPSMKFNYVVIQPSVGQTRTNSHQPLPSSSTSFPRRKSPSPRPTEAIVRTYPLSPKRINNRISSSQEHRNPVQANEVKKEPLNFGRPGVLVEVEPTSGYPNPNTKMYKVLRSANPQGAVTVTTAKRVLQIPHRTTSLGFDPLPDHLGESSSVSAEPPKKKLNIDGAKVVRNTTIVRANSVNLSNQHPENTLQNSKILTNVVPMVDDEIVLNAEGECKLGPSGLIHDTAQPSTSQDHEINPSMTGDQDDAIQHYHHDIEDNAVIEEEIEPQPIGNGHDLTVQYDEDLAFQQHINSVLNRLPDDEKALIKFNMQRIILDARFGQGTARSMFKDDELLEVETHVEIDPNPVETEDQI